jgi:hypothetical protein
MAVFLFGADAARDRRPDGQSPVGDAITDFVGGQFGLYSGDPSRGIAKWRRPDKIGLIRRLYIKLTTNTIFSPLPSGDVVLESPTVCARAEHGDGRKSAL